MGSEITPLLVSGCLYRGWQEVKKIKTPWGLASDKFSVNFFSEGYRRCLALCLTSSVSQSVSAFFFKTSNLCLNDQAYDCLIHFYKRGPIMHPVIENQDSLWWKMSFDGRQPLTEDDLWGKTTFDGRRPLMEDDLWRKTTFHGRRHLMEDDLWPKRTWKTTSDGRRHLTEDDLWRKTTFDGRRPFNFSTDQDRIKVMAQNCAKTEGPTKKIDKINFEVHRPRNVSHLLTLM